MKALTLIIIVAVAAVAAWPIAISISEIVLKRRSGDRRVWKYEERRER